MNYLQVLQSRVAGGSPETSIHAPPPSRTSNTPSSSRGSSASPLNRTLPLTDTPSDHPSPSSVKSRPGTETTRTRQRRGSYLIEHKLSRLSWSPAVALENSGSVARDHLASERTFLAYVRTSLGIASTGVALVQLFTISTTKPNALPSSSPSIERFARPLGGATILIALLTLLYGTCRFFLVQYTLVRGKYPMARVSPAVLGLAVGAVVGVVFGVLVGVRR